MKKGRILLSSLIATTILCTGCSAGTEEKKEENKTETKSNTKDKTILSADNFNFINIDSKKAAEQTVSKEEFNKLSQKELNIFLKDLIKNKKEELGKSLLYIKFDFGDGTAVLVKGSENVLDYGKFNKEKRNIEQDGTTGYTYNKNKEQYLSTVDDKTVLTIK